MLIGVNPMVDVGISVSTSRPDVIDLIVTREQMHQNEITYLASEPVRQASRSKRARDASHTFFFLLHNKVWL